MHPAMRSGEAINLPNCDIPRSVEPSKIDSTMPTDLLSWVLYNYTRNPADV